MLRLWRLVVNGKSPLIPLFLKGRGTVAFFKGGNRLLPLAKLTTKHSLSQKGDGKVFPKGGI